jgi:hypothetical protein
MLTWDSHREIHQAICVVDGVHTTFTAMLGGISMALRVTVGGQHGVWRGTAHLHSKRASVEMAEHRSTCGPSKRNTTARTFHPPFFYLKLSRNLKSLALYTMFDQSRHFGSKVPAFPRLWRISWRSNGPVVKLNHRCPKHAITSAEIK